MQSGKFRGKVILIFSEEDYANIMPYATGFIGSQLHVFLSLHLKKKPCFPPFLPLLKMGFILSPSIVQIN
jgi:hypothetical protein